MIRAAALVLATVAGPAFALDFALPVTARQTAERNTNADVYRAPTGVFSQDVVPGVIIEGGVNRSAWRISSPGLAPLQVIRPLRDQLSVAGFDIVLDCATVLCGGFDFRFATEVLPGPNMYVNIRAYHFVTGTRGGTQDAPSEIVTLLASTSANAAYLQIIHAKREGVPEARVEARAVLPIAETQPGEPSFAQDLLSRGHAVLTDLEFDSGSAALGAGPFAALAALAAFLKSQPELRVALVGHTDTVGSLAGNIAISRARAQAVRQRLIDEFGVPAAQLDAEGMGYLSPIASNLDPAGRDRNRRVEVVILGGP